MKDLSNIKVLVSFLVLFVITSMVINAQDGVDKEAYISLGLLVNKQNAAAAGCSAELAVKEINDLGGINGKPLKLIIRSVEGSWGAGSREVVDLVFKEKVTAILGSIDGRNSHLAEQVIAKTQVLYLSAWASDPSLSKAYVPWYFSLVPTDDQQAILFLEELRVKKRVEKILVVHDQSYDAAQALKSIRNASNEMDGLSISAISYESSGSKDLLTRIENNSLEAVILLGRNIPVSAILNQLIASRITIPVYANLSAQASQDFAQSEMQFTNQLNVIHSRDRSSPDYKRYHKNFVSECKEKPGPIAIYAFDGIMIISEALKQAGDLPESLQKSMSKINYQGLTGAVQFDSRGRLKNTGELLIIKE